MAVEFQDNRMAVKAALDAAITAYLYEAGGELEGQVKRNTRVGSTSQTKNNWKYVVDESKAECTVGNPLENALWEEFGTGEFALKGDGRKGYWVYVEGNEGTRSTSQKQYTLEEAKQTVAFLRSKGLEAHYTKGKKPNRAFQHAFDSLKAPLIRRAAEVLKARME